MPKETKNEQLKEQPSYNTRQREEPQVKSEVEDVDKPSDNVENVELTRDRNTDIEQGKPGERRTGARTVMSRSVRQEGYKEQNADFISEIIANNDNLPRKRKLPDAEKREGTSALK